MKIIAGLGNPGSKYAFTRHNAGFLFIDYISQKYNIRTDKIKFKSLCGQGIIAGEKTLILKPQTFMNLSGEAILSVLDFYKASPKDLIVIYDDIALPVGKLRVRSNGTDGGHNGMKSIIYLLGSDEFDRIKLGVGAPRHEDFGLVDFVLSGFSEDEKKTLFKVIESASKALELLIAGRGKDAMNAVNGIDLSDRQKPTKADERKENDAT